MQLVKINATKSTNSYLKELILEHTDLDECAVVAENQFAGRGQMGATWYSQPGKSLTFSIYKKHLNIAISNQIYLSMAVAVAMVEILKKTLQDRVSIKWPNDIMADAKKIGGILIENSTQANQIKSTIIGIGLNVNETEFEALPHASSIQLLTGFETHREDLLLACINSVSTAVDRCQVKMERNQFRALYISRLYRKDKVSEFILKDGSIFTGTIISVNQSGQLEVITGDGTTKYFNTKEMAYNYDSKLS